MGLQFGEGRFLKDKYMKKYGLTQSEAIERVSAFCNYLDKVKSKMKLQKKSELQIKQKEQEIFEKEFQKLCLED
jgi:uncharacterized protein YnzC (UPF0291/DUF896 family)